MDLKDLLSSKKILVVGDVILDHYIYGKVYRVSPEAPVPVVLKSNSTYCLGGSANVAQNVSSFGSECWLLGVYGNDQGSVEIDNLLGEKNIHSLMITDISRPTVEKTRVIGNSHQIVRIDSETSDPLTSDIQDEVLESFNNIIHQMDGVIIQDYGKGMLSGELISKITDICTELEIPTLTDPKDRDFSKYIGSTWIKPNLSEFKSSLNIPQPEAIDLKRTTKLMDSLMDSFGFRGVLLTLSEDGMMLKTNSDFEQVDGIQIEVTDVSGAGDTVSAVFMLLLTNNVSYLDCLRISNLAGSLVCQVSGAVPVDSNNLYMTLLKNSWVITSLSGEPILI
jgi:rfaE bifunctional protein kinase chain/domain